MHLRRGTVHLVLVKWLCVGSVPAAFAGVLVARALGNGAQMQSVIRTALASALLCSAAGLMVRAYIRLIEHARVRDGRAARCHHERRRCHGARVEFRNIRVNELYPSLPRFLPTSVT